MGFENLTDIIKQTAELLPDHPAQRYWDGSRWIDRSYRDLWLSIQATARGLKALGVAPGDRVGILAQTRPEWVIADYAILLLDAVTVPIFPSSTREQIAYIFEDAGIQWVIVDNDSMREKLPGDGSYLFFDASPGDACGFAQVAQPGPDIMPVNGRTDLATIVYTSGTTGIPKGVMLTHGNLLANVEAVTEVASRGTAMRMTPEDVALTFLPLSHILERTGHNVLLRHGVTIAYARSVDRMANDLLAVRPTLMVAVPRIFEKIYSRIEHQVQQYSRIKRYVFDLAVKTELQRYEMLIAEQSLPQRLVQRHQRYDRLVFQKVREAVGGRLRFVIAGGAPLTPEIGRFFFAVGIPVLEGYGLTETAPVLAVNFPPVPRYGTVGRPLPGVEVRIAKDGEILVRGPNVFQGYWNMPRETREAMVEGWFLTGDQGELTVDGYLVVNGRKKQLIVLSTGKNVAPQAVEQRLTLSPWIEQAVVLGDRRKYLTALLYLDPDRLAEWAHHAGLASLDTPILLKNPSLMATVLNEVQRTTKDLADFERPKRVAFLTEALSEEHGELTASLKVKLAEVQNRYSLLIDAMYGESVDAQVVSTINRRDPFALGRVVVAVGAGVALALIIRWVAG